MQQLQAGMQALQAGSLDAAEHIFRNILSANSSEVHSLHFLGVIFCQRGKLDDGVALIERSIRLDPSRFGPYLNLGRFLLGANQWDRAVAALQQAVQRDVNSFDAWSMLAQSSFFAGNADAALKAGRRAAEINPGNAEIFFSLGVYASGSNKDEAINHYRHSVSIDPESFKALVNLGNCLLDSKRIEESITAFNAAIEIEPSCFQALMGLCRAYGDLAKWLEALDMAKQALILDSSSHDAAFWVGYSLYKLDRKKEAVNAYHAALAISPVAAQTHLYLASVLEGLSEEQDALKHYELATKVDPKLSLAFAYWGALLQKCGDLKLAIDKFRRAVEANPLSAETLLGLGASLHESGEVEEAIASYRRAIQVKPDFADAYFNLGTVLKEVGDVEEAIASYRRAIEVKPDFAEAYYALGLVMMEEGEIEEAIASYRRAIEVKPDFVIALSDLASALVKRDEFDEAIDLYKRALIEDPEHGNSSLGLGWCFLRSDRSEEAIEYYSNLLISSPGDKNAYFFLFEAFRGELQVKLQHDFSYSTNFLKKCLELMCVSNLVAFGDSHVLLFEGCNEIDVNHVGASTAYNLIKDDSSTGGRRQVLSRVGRMNPMTEAVLFCFGEVDIRANVIKYCYLNGLSIEECVDGVVDRYMSFARKIALRGFKILVYGGYGAGGDRISVGSKRERNYAAKCLNASLSVKCKENSFVYFSLHDVLLDEDCLETDSSFLSDGFHLYNDEPTTRGQVQTLLFERACQSAKALFEKRKNQSSRHVVLGNVGVSKPLRVGSLESGCLSWDAEYDPLESVVFDLGAFIRFESINLELELDLDADRMNLILDGRFVEVNISRESSCRWYLRPLDQTVPFFGRYPMLKASSDFLLSIKGFSAKGLSLV